MSDAIGTALIERLDAFAAFSAEAGALTRLYLTPEHRAAADQLMAWMREAGMTVRLDAAATVVGRYEGSEPGLPAVLIGSHIDTVRNAGKYDGNFGVLAAVAAVAELNRAGERLPFAVEVLGFGDEEGVRFPITLTGSRAVAGTVTQAALDGRDQSGIRMADALAAFGAPPDIATAARRRADTLAYLELHIEQGPVLEAEGLPVGVVTAINGATRAAVSLAGMAGHAGTVPMGLRHDALTAAAEMVLAVELCGNTTPGLVATVGRLEARPGAANVIPGDVRFTLDIRSPDDAVRTAAVARILASFTTIAERRGVAMTVERGHDAAATACDPAIIAQFEAAVGRAGMTPLRLGSGAGHDAMAVAALCPVGMLFVRCRGGVSHHPDESITATDAGTAVRVLLDVLRHFSPTKA